ncbi:MAG TPA: hypothetical protein VGC93_09080, partial [Thermoanaerobaculia bacterium]
MPEVRLPANDLYGIGLDDLLDDDGTIRYRSGKVLRAAFRLPPDGRVCLLASVQDGPLENLWSRSLTDAIWMGISQLGFEFVTGFSFSVYEQQSRAGQIWAAERNMASAELLGHAGLPVVPLFCEVIEEDLEFAARWLEERPSLEVIGGLAQGWRTDAEFERFLMRMKFLKNAVARPLHFLIVGCSSANRVKLLFRELTYVTVATANLEVLSRVVYESRESGGLLLLPILELHSCDDVGEEGGAVERAPALLCRH